MVPAGLLAADSSMPEIQGWERSEIYNLFKSSNLTVRLQRVKISFIATPNSIALKIRN